MPWTIDGTEDTLDSREIMERIEELAANDTEGTITEDERAELGELTALMSQAESSPDWRYGETLIRDSYFIEYTEQLIDDCYPEVSKALASSDWPMRHLKLDIEDAAQELKTDYFDVTFNGSTYWIRG